MIDRNRMLDIFVILLDVDPVPHNVDHWVRKPTRLRRRPLQRYDTYLQYIMLIDEGDSLTLKEARSCGQLAMQEE